MTLIRFLVLAALAYTIPQLICVLWAIHIITDTIG